MHSLRAVLLGDIQPLLYFEYRTRNFEQQKF